MRSPRAVGPLAIVALITAIFSVVPGAARSAEGGQGFYVASFEDVITDQLRRVLLRTGIEIVDYEPRDSYIVWADEFAARAARDLTGISSVSPLPVARKIAPALSVNGKEQSSGIHVTVHSSAVGEAVDYLDRRGAVVSSAPLDAHERLWTVTARLPLREAGRLAAQRWTMYVSPAPGRVVLHDEMGTLTVAASIEDGRPAGDYQEWLARHDLSGTGVTVSVADTGITTQHPDLEGRVDRTFSYGSGDGSVMDSAGHGTHVAGIVAGAPSGEGPPFDDPNGFAYGQGVAPEVRLIDQNLSPLLSGSHQDFFGKLAEDAWRSGARIFNGSWGTSEGNRVGYVAHSRRFDELARDAISGGRGLKELLFVFSAGNSGEAGPSSPHEAKNIITVGAMHSGRGQHYPLESDIDEPAPFSSRGPALDERIFPTLSAPGAWLVSTRAPLGVRTPACLGPVDGLGLYCSKSGTSMAAPHVSGTAALVHEWWERKRGALPSPAMVKALLVNSATKVGMEDIPNDMVGWGRVNLEALLTWRIHVVDDQRSVFRKPGASKSYTVRMKKSSPLKATVAWADAPGAVGASPALVNDLDLIVERIHRGKVRQVWRGNNFASSWSSPQGSPDRLNNIENVFIREAGSGLYRITVRAANLPGDGIPGNGDETDQDYALVVTTP